jgi:hypothetical protein
MRWTNGWLRLVVALVLSVVTLGKAFAESAPPPNYTRGDLERSYQHLLVDIAATETKLSDGERYAQQLDDIIAKLKAKGEDTTALGEAVALFRARLRSLSSENAAVRTRLTVNSGFDLGGVVVDKGVARLTVKDTKKMLATMDGYLAAYYDSLHKAIQDYHNTGEGRKFHEPAQP